MTWRVDDALQLRWFATVADTCDRVLGAGVACRFEGRLLPAYEAVKKMKEEDSLNWTPRSPERRVLHYAGACRSRCVDTSSGKASSAVTAHFTGRRVQGCPSTTCIGAWSGW